MMLDGFILWPGCNQILLEVDAAVLYGDCKDVATVYIHLTIHILTSIIMNLHAWRLCLVAIVCDLLVKWLVPSQCLPPHHDVFLEIFLIFEQLPCLAYSPRVTGAAP